MINVQHNAHVVSKICYLVILLYLISLIKIYDF